MENQIVEIQNFLKTSIDEVQKFKLDPLPENRERFRSWKNRVIQKLRKFKLEEVASEFEKKVDVVRTPDELYEALNGYLARLSVLLEDIEKYPESLFGLPAKTHQEMPKSLKDVFIVHGHDAENLSRLEKLLKQKGFNPIILKERPGGGRTIIEKFEQEATKASYAFVLFTPDDPIVNKDISYTQARPNVIFETGWFYGRLGRNRVCILFKKGTRIHSDLDGISRIEYVDFIDEKVDEIQRELIEAGLIPSIGQTST